MHQGLVDLRRRMAHAERHIQQNDGHARHLRHIRRDVQILEKGIVGTAEQMRQRRRQQRLAEAARARQKGVLDRLFQHALDMRRFIHVRLSRLAQGREVVFVQRERSQRRHEGPPAFYARARDLIVARTRGSVLQMMGYPSFPSNIRP